MSGLDSLGGKGTNLVRLREMGLPVPPFVVLPVSEYHAFVASQGLDTVISQALTLEANEASAAIRAAFRRPLSAEQRARLTGIIGISDATRFLATGDVVILDGSAGTVARQ